MVNGGYLSLSRQKELVTFMQTIKNGVSVDVLPVNAQKKSELLHSELSKPFRISTIRQIYLHSWNYWSSFSIQSCVGTP